MHSWLLLISFILSQWVCLMMIQAPLGFMLSLEVVLCWVRCDAKATSAETGSSCPTFQPKSLLHQQ
jgi:hypothetical protein